MLLELAAELPDRARMALTADHGLIDLNRDQKVAIFDGDPLLDCLRTVPSGEGRTPHFHVRDGRASELIERLADRCGGPDGRVEPRRSGRDAAVRARAVE